MPNVTRGVEELAERLRRIAPAVAVEVTDQFLDRHPDWRERYGSRAVTHGVQDANYHLSFLAAAVESGDPDAFAAYAQWTARVLAARGMASQFLVENLEQIRDAIATRAPDRAPALAPYFSAALDALREPPEAGGATVLNLTAGVFLQAILTGQRLAAVQVAREALREGMTLQELYVEVFQPALYEVGARWECNRLTVAQEHIATAVTQYVMAQIYEPPPATDNPKGMLVLTGVEGELHHIGAIMVGDLVEQSGWRVRFLGTNLPSSTILSAIREAAPTHVGISATMLFNVSAVHQIIQALRAEFGQRITVMVGGAAFRSRPDLWRQVAADAFASDLRGVQALLARS